MTTNNEQFAGLRSVVTDLTPPTQLRASDADREATAVRIRRAYVEASLTLEEFDTRTAAAWAATTRAELAALTSDLPVAAPANPLPVTPIPPMRSLANGNKGRKALHILTMIWLTVSLVDFAVWALVCIGSLSWIYPWWIWVFVPAGTALFTISRFVKQPRS